MTNKRSPKLMLSCAQEAGMSEATAASWDPGLWMYPVMSVHEDIEGNISTTGTLEDEQGTFYFAEFDCGCKFYVPSTMIRGAHTDDELPGDVEVSPDPELLSPN